MFTGYDIQVFNSSGERLPLFTEDVAGLDINYTERGGWEVCTVQVPADWNPFRYDGSEYIDVYLFGERVFRGWLGSIDPALNDAGNQTLKFYGLMQRLDRYIVDRDFCYAGKVNVADVVTEILETYAKRTGRIPDLEIDVTDAEAAGLEIGEFSGNEKSVTQTLNAILQRFPNYFSWFSDVNPATGNDRVIFRRRASAVLYHYIIGDRITAFTLPRNVLGVVNILRINGGTVTNANLAENADFTECLAPDDPGANILRNASFEITTADPEEPDDWVLFFRARVHYSPTFADLAWNGTKYLHLDNFNTGSPESAGQYVPISQLAALRATCYARQENPSGGIGFYIYLYVLDSVGTVLDTAVSAIMFPPGTGDYQLFEFSHDFGTVVGAAQVAVEYQVSNLASSGNGIVIDDAALYIAIPQARGWRVGTNVTAHFDLLEWFNRDAGITPKSGGTVVKAEVVIESPGGYVELSGTEDARINVRPNQTYRVSVWFNASVGNIISVGARKYNGDTLEGEDVRTPIAVAGDGNWYEIVHRFRTGNDTTEIEPVIRIHDDGELYLDAFGVYMNEIPADYRASDRYAAVLTTDDFTAGEIGTEQAASRTTYGDAEAVESVDTITDSEDAEAYAKGYFQGKAIPEITGRLEISNAKPSDVIKLDGTIRVVNLENAPDPLVPARVQYVIGDDLTVTVDLNNEIPNLPQILRDLQERKL